MSTRDLRGIGTTRRTTDTSSSYLDTGLQLLGAFFFVNGVYVAFFSDNIFTTFGYYFVVFAAICAVVSLIISPEDPLISPELQRKMRQLVEGSNTSRTTRSGGLHSSRRNDFDIRRYLRRAVRTFARFGSRLPSQNNGRNRL